MQFDSIVHNGTFVTARDTYPVNLGIADGSIAAIAQNLPVESPANAIDAKDHLVMPSGIDVHTHSAMPFRGTTSAEGFETGTRAAAFGGATTLVDFAIQYEGQSLYHACETWVKKAEGKAASEEPGSSYGGKIIRELREGLLDTCEVEISAAKAGLMLLI